jgi:hypothetical protein
LELALKWTNFKDSHREAESGLECDPEENIQERCCLHWKSSATGKVRAGDKIELWLNRV